MALRPSEARLSQRVEGARATPAGTTPSTLAFSSRLPRSLNTRTRSPVRIARGSASSGCRCRMEVSSSTPGPIAEGRVHAVVVLGGNQLQRILAPQRLIAEARFHRRRVLQTFRSELAFARGRSEAALSERQERRISGASTVQPHEMLALQALQRDPVQERMPRSENRADHVVFRVAEAGSSKPMRRASARNIWTLDCASPGAGSAGRASGK